MNPPTPLEHDAAPAEPARQPSGRRCRDGGRDEVERDDPGDLVVGGRKRAPDLGQDHVGQRDGHSEQQARQLHGQQDQPLPRGDAAQPSFPRSRAHLLGRVRSRMLPATGEIASRTRRECRASPAWKRVSGGRYHPAQGVPQAMICELVVDRQALGRGDSEKAFSVGAARISTSVSRSPIPPAVQDDRLGVEIVPRDV